MKKDTKNEYIGIVSIIIVVIIAIVAIYFYSRQPQIGPKELKNTTISLNHSVNQNLHSS